MKRLILPLVAFLFFGTLWAQQAPNESAVKGVIKGRIQDAREKVPIEYANVAVLSAVDESIVSGGVTGPNGTFSIRQVPDGKYVLVAKFIGYEAIRKENITVGAGKRVVDLGVIDLKPASQNIGDVEVVAEKRAVVYKIDKKVVNPSQFPAAAGGTATDVLANTPSISVDAEGNVSLRGSSSFTVLIDGKPTPFEPNDALEQIPTSAIENIEIITNPSAKYDPDGTAGIINILTKKNQLQGVSGIFNANASSTGAYGGDFVLSYRTGKVNFFVGADRNERRRDADLFRQNEIMKDGITHFTESEGERNGSRTSQSLKGGFDFDLNENNSFSFSMNYGKMEWAHDATSKYLEWRKPSEDPVRKYQNLSDQSREGDFISYNMDYILKLGKKDHELQTSFYYNKDKRKEFNDSRLIEDGQGQTDGQQSWEDEEGDEWRFKTDYTLPLGEKHKFESGYQWRRDSEDGWNDLVFFDPESGNYSPQRDTNFHQTYYNRDIHSLYGTFGGESGKLGYQLGLRGEYTDRSLDYTGSEETYELSRWDWFPTMHVSYQLPSDQQVMTSYTRRIRRPRGYYLEPFPTYTDPFNIRIGDPNVEPEYINSVELGYQKRFGRNFLSLEGYYRHTENKIERVRSVYSETVMLHTIENVGNDYSLGLELMLNWNLSKWWTINVMGNYYDYRMEGEAQGQVFDTSSRNWSARMNNSFRVTPTTRLQLDGFYNSATVTSQGRREPFGFTTLSLRQDFFKRKVIATISARDILNTGKWEFTSTGDDFSNYTKYDMVSPVITFNIQYKLNNFKSKKRREGEGNGMEMMNGDGF